MKTPEPAQQIKVNTQEQLAALRILAAFGEAAYKFGQRDITDPHGHKRMHRYLVAARKVVHAALGRPGDIPELAAVMGVKPEKLRQFVNWWFLSAGGAVNPEAVKQAGGKPPLKVVNV